MKKILVVSDNHFQKNEFIDIVKHNHLVDYFVHCGDSQWNPQDEELKNFIVVKGNNDFVKFPDDELFEVEGNRILVTHGHNQYVINVGEQDNTEGTKDLVSYAIAEYNANIVLYGHTHVPEAHIDRNVFVLNPGSTNFPRGFIHRDKSYAILTIDKTNIYANFYNAKTHEDITRKILG